MNKINTFITGTTGATATALIPEILQPITVNDVQTITQIIIQIVIGVITIVKILRSKTNETKNTQQ